MEKIEIPSELIERIAVWIDLVQLGDSHHNAWESKELEALGHELAEYRKF